VKSQNACSHSEQNLLSSKFLSQNIQVKVDKTVILPLILYRCEAWFLTLKEEQKLRVFEKRVLRKICWPKWDEVTGQ